MKRIPARALLQPRVEEFLTYCGARNFSRNTIRAYRADLKEFLALAGEIEVRQLNRKLLRSLIARLYNAGVKRTSIWRKVAAVRSFCKWLDGEGLLDSTLIETLRPSRHNQELPDVPSEAEVRMLLEDEIPTASPERDLVIMELLYSAGLRASEVAGVNLDDFRDEDVLLVRGKGRKERQVIFGEYAQAAIRAWLPVRAKLLESGL